MCVDLKLPQVRQEGRGPKSLPTMAAQLVALLLVKGPPSGPPLPRLEDGEGGLKDFGNLLRPAIVRLMRAENKMLGERPWS